MADLEVDYLAVVLRDLRRDTIHKESKNGVGALATSGQNRGQSASLKSNEQAEPRSSPSMATGDDKYDNMDVKDANAVRPLRRSGSKEERERSGSPGSLSNPDRTMGASSTSRAHASLNEVSPNTHLKRSSSDLHAAADERRSRLGPHVPTKPIEPPSVAQETPQRLPFRPKRTFPIDTLLHEFMRHTSALVEAGEFREAARRPAGVHGTGEWLKINAFLYYNKANEFFGLLKERCACDRMSIGRKYEYMWADGKTIRKPINIPAVDYVEYVMEWVEANFDDAKLFPLYDDAGPSHGFTTVAKDIFKRLFRVFGHMESLHREDLEAQEPGSAAELESTFHCFVEFVKTFKLMDKKSLAPIRSLQDKWKGMER